MNTIQNKALFDIRGSIHNYNLHKGRHRRNRKLLKGWQWCDKCARTQRKLLLSVELFKLVYGESNAPE